ncbi:hypothetical protein [Natronospora cellulosivora (SeqCode)]
MSNTEVFLNEIAEGLLYSSLNINYYDEIESLYNFLNLLIEEKFNEAEVMFHPNLATPLWYRNIIRQIENDDKKRDSD